VSRLVWLLLGLVGGIAIARNAEPMSAPALSAVALMFVAACGICWFAAYRGKSVAVATAVAVAQAKADAHAESLSAALADAQAQAAALAQVNLTFAGAGAGGETAPLAAPAQEPALALDQDAVQRLALAYPHLLPSPAFEPTVEQLREHYRTESEGTV
jgi:hypothetical protein